MGSANVVSSSCEYGYLLPSFRIKSDIPVLALASQCPDCNVVTPSFCLSTCFIVLLFFPKCLYSLKWDYGVYFHGPRLDICVLSVDMLGIFDLFENG